MSDNPYQSPDVQDRLQLPEPKRRSRVLEWVAFAVVAGLVLLLLIPSTRTAREAARRMQCSNHLRQIGLALLAYEQEYGYLPPAYTVDASGKPLHSWRTLLLPYLDKKELYAKIDLSKPWDHPVNREARESRIPEYQCPSTEVAPTFTTYVAIVTKESCLQPGKPRRLVEIRDGYAFTIVVAELPGSRSIHWMSPSDTDEQTLLSTFRLRNTPHPSVLNVLFVDGHISRLGEDLDPDVLHALITAAGNDQDGIDEDAF